MLKDLVIFHRNENGNLTTQATVQQARFDGDAWWLEGIDDFQIQPNAKQAPGLIARQPWTTALRPDVVHDLAAPPNALSVNEISRLLSLPEITSRPLHVYQIWWHKSFAIPLASLFMVVLATTSVRGLQRQGGVVVNALIGFAGAFLYFVTDGVLTALGEAGSINPGLAAWCPLLFLALIAAAVLFWVSMPNGRRRAKARPSQEADEQASAG